MITAHGTLGQVYGGRFVMGLGIGQTGIVAPTYLAEIAPRNARGFLVCLFGMSEYIGIMIGVSAIWRDSCICTNLTSTSLHGVPHCTFPTAIPSSGSFHRAYKSLLPDSCFSCHSYARKVLGIFARLARERKQGNHWEDYGTFLGSTIWFSRRWRAYRINSTQSSNRHLVDPGSLRWRSCSR